MLKAIESLNPMMFSKYVEPLVKDYLPAFFPEHENVEPFSFLARGDLNTSLSITPICLQHGHSPI